MSITRGQGNEISAGKRCARSWGLMQTAFVWHVTDKKAHATRAVMWLLPDFMSLFTPLVNFLQECLEHLLFQPLTLVDTFNQMPNLGHFLFLVGTIYIVQM